MVVPASALTLRRMSTSRRQERSFHNRSFRELHRAKIVFANFRLAKQVRALPKHQSAAGAEARSVRLLTLVVASFSLISRCTHRAHAAF
jgi:hypothetical protein